MTCYHTQLWSLLLQILLEKTYLLWCGPVCFALRLTSAEVDDRDETQAPFPALHLMSITRALEHPSAKSGGLGWVAIWSSAGCHVQNGGRG